MKKITIIIALLMFSLASFGQFEIDYDYLRQQQKEIANSIRPELEAQIRAQVMKDLEKRRQNQDQMQSTQSTTQTARQQSLQDFNNRITTEGQQRMEYYNNPDNYIDRSITNRSTTYGSHDAGYRPQSQPRDLRTRPVHSENLNSKSLQMLREANREYFSNEDGEPTITPDSQVPLFEAPSLGEYPMKSIEDKEMSQRASLSKDGEIWDEMRTIFDEIQIQGIANAMKSTNGGELPAALVINDKGDYIFESKPSEANLEDDGHYDRVYSVSPNGVLTYATFDEHFFK